MCKEKIVHLYQLIHRHDLTCYLSTSCTGRNFQCPIFFSPPRGANPGSLGHLVQLHQLLASAAWKSCEFHGYRTFSSHRGCGDCDLWISCATSAEHCLGVAGILWPFLPYCGGFNSVPWVFLGNTEGFPVM